MSDKTHNKRHDVHVEVASSIWQGFENDELDHGDIFCIVIGLLCMLVDDSGGFRCFGNNEKDTKA